MASLLDILGQSKNNSLAPAGGSYSQPGPGALSGAPVAAPRAAGGRNPFSSVFASDAPGLAGFLGKLSGAPTGDEMVMQRLGGQQAQGLAGLQRRIDSGMAPQAAVTDFISSPEGQEFFGSSQDPIGAIKGYLQLSQKPADKFTMASPGQTVFNESTGELGQTLPTTKSLELSDMAAAADYTPAQTRDVARALLAKEAAPDSSEAERGTQRMLDLKLISPEMKAKIDSGTISIKASPPDPLTGQPTGYIMIDTSKFLQSMDPKDIVTVVLGANNGGAMGDGGEDISQLDLPPVPGDIIFGAGLGGTAGAAAGGVGGMISSKLSAPELNRSRSALKNIFATASGIMGSNNRLAAGMKFFTDSVDKTGLTSNPGEQAQALMQLRSYVDQEMAVNGATLHDPTSGKEVKNEAQKNLLDLRRLAAIMPTMEDLQVSYDAYEKEGKGTLPDLIQQGAKKVGDAVEGISKTIDAAKGAASATEKAVEGQGASEGGNVPKAFKTEQEAAAAAQAGTLKAGDRVTIGGVPGTWAD